jgi:predicted PurR-regulated permease PerM
MRSKADTKATAAGIEDGEKKTPASRDEEAGPATNGSGISRTLDTAHWLRLLIVLATTLAVVAVAAVAIRLAAAIGHTLLLFALGGLVAYALDPLVDRIQGRPNSDGKRRSRTTSTLAVFLAAAVVLAAGIALLGHEMTRQINIVAKDHDQLEQTAHARIDRVDAWLAAHGIHVNLAEYAKHPPEATHSWGEAIAGHVVKALGDAGRDIVEIAVVGLITLYFLIYAEEMRAIATQAAPDALRPYLTRWADDVNHILGGFVRGQLILALILGGLASVICAALGLKLWLLLGLFVVVLSLIPVIGPYLGAIPAIFASFVSPHAHLSPAVRVVILILAFVAINEVGSKILYPRLVGKALGLHEVLVLFMLLAGLELGGIIGVLFAAPLTALGAVTLAHLYRVWNGLPPIALSPAPESRSGPPD